MKKKRIMEKTMWTVINIDDWMRMQTKTLSRIERTLKKIIEQSEDEK